MDKLSFMKAFCRIVELDNVSKAAEDMGYSASVLSRELKATEEGLGVSLMARTTRKLTLTDHGRTYYKECQRILNDLDHLESGMREGGQKPRGVLKVNMPQSFGLSVVSPNISRFVTAYPDIDLQLNLDDRVLDMVKEGFDLSIRVLLHLDDSNLLARKIGMVTQKICASPGYLKGRQIPEIPADLLSHNVLGFSLSQHLNVWEFVSRESHMSVSVNPPTLVNNSLFLRDMLCQDLGIASLPNFICDPLLKEGKLVELLPDFRLPSRSIYAVTPSRLGLDAKTKAFVQFIESLI
ncbi:MAG: LysR family transcriptional regulator [Alphaproteobacteria bacterium]|nr:LysR family transcriptional regulator [Alphaproteobacteria bacterium]